MKVLQYFSKAVFLVLSMESLLVEEEVLSRLTKITAERAIAVDPTVGSRLKFYTSFGGRFRCITDGIPTR